MKKLKKWQLFTAAGAAIAVIGTGSVVRTAVIFFYISNEGISLLENAVSIGLPVPEKIKEALKQLHGKEDESNGNQ